MTAEPLRLVLGTAALVDDHLTPRLLDQFYEAGGRAIDLANVYADGEAERAVGGWLARRGGDALLYVKGCHPPSCAPELVSSEVETARSNLRVDRLDVFILHRDDPAVGVRAWADALIDVLQRGTVAAVGVSNWTVERFLGLRTCLQELGEERMSVFSNHFSLADMAAPPWPDCLAVDAETAAALVGSGITVLAWASLAGGFLGDGEANDEPVLRTWGTDENRHRRARSADLAKQVRSTPATIAIAYVLAHEGVRPVIGTRSSEHLSEALAAEQIDLTLEQVAYLESSLPA